MAVNFFCWAYVFYDFMVFFWHFFSRFAWFFGTQASPKKKRVFGFYFNASLRKKLWLLSF